MPYIRINSNKANALLAFLFFIIIIFTAGYIVYHNPDFQKSHRQEIRRSQAFYKHASGATSDFLNDTQKKSEQWLKDHPLQVPKWPLGTNLQNNKTPTFQELIYDPDTLSKEIPPAMVRHKVDEITVCSFDADYLFNSPLTEKEQLHLANILRFCDLTTFSGLKDTHQLGPIIRYMRILHYNAETVFSPVSGKTEKTFYAFLFRRDRINSVKSSKLWTEGHDLAIAPFSGSFKSGTFDFTIINFRTPKNGQELDSLSPLENIYETAKIDSPTIEDVIMFGDFIFQSSGFAWDNSSLLPAVARLNKQKRTTKDLLGNLWFRKKDLTEFNGRCGTINIKSELFPSAAKSASAPKPVWAQFKLMPDDD